MKRLLWPLADPPPSEVTVDGPRFHHLVHVLRLEEGEELEVFDGAGRAFGATVTSVGEQSAVLRLGAIRSVTSRRPLYVVQGLPKADKLEWILQKGTELGALGFLPVETARSVVRLAGDKAKQKAARWQKIVEEAARQCGRADVPKVEVPQPILPALEALAADTALLLLDEEERDHSLSGAFTALPSTTAVALIVGPEGGWEPNERQALIERGAKPVTLGAQVLRTETASLAALAVLLHLDGVLG